MRKLIQFGCCWAGITLGVIEALYYFVPDRMVTAVIVLAVVLGGLLAWKLVLSKQYVYVAMVREKDNNAPHIIVFDDEELSLDFADMVDEHGDEVMVAKVPVTSQSVRMGDDE